MKRQEIESPAELQDAIRCFWHTSIDFGEELSTFEILPDSYAEIIFHFGTDCNVFYDGQLQPLPSPFLMGMLSQPVHIQAKNRLEVIGIRCFPWTVFNILGLPPGQESIRALEHPIALLQPTLNQHIQNGDVDKALAEVKQYFLNARMALAPGSLLFKAGAAMRQANGSMPVSMIAASAHATIRTLERNFKQSSGYTIKDVSGVMRFEQVRNCLWLNPYIKLTSLAQELGYTDQAHLSREFKRYTGTSPAAFARRIKNGKHNP